MLKVIVREELGFGAIGNRERPMSRHIPYLRHVADTVIKLEDGALMSVIKLDGLFFQTEDQAELNMRSVVQNTLIRALGSSRFSLWSTVIRRQVDTDDRRRIRRSVLRGTSIAATAASLAESGCSPTSST